MRFPTLAMLAATLVSPAMAQLDLTGIWSPVSTKTNPREFPVRSWSIT